MNNSAFTEWRAGASNATQLRAGLHTGEVELIGDDVGGIAVHIGARVAASAAPGEILVSQTVRDLVVGSGIAFEDRGLAARPRGRRRSGAGRLS